MALVTKLAREERNFRSIHPTEVECRYVVDERDGRKLIQLNTYGSSERQIPDKLSQTLQFSEESARELWAIIGKEFGFNASEGH